MINIDWKTINLHKQFTVSISDEILSMDTLSKYIENILYKVDRKYMDNQICKDLNNMINLINMINTKDNNIKQSNLIKKEFILKKDCDYYQENRFTFDLFNIFPKLDE